MVAATECTREPLPKGEGEPNRALEPAAEPCAEPVAAAATAEADVAIWLYH